MYKSILYTYVLVLAMAVAGNAAAKTCRFVQAGPDMESYLTCDSCIEVSTEEDIMANDGKCSLREAIMFANYDSPKQAIKGECRFKFCKEKYLTIKLKAKEKIYTIDAENKGPIPIEGKEIHIESHDDKKVTIEIGNWPYPFDLYNASLVIDKHVKIRSIDENSAIGVILEELY